MPPLREVEARALLRRLLKEGVFIVSSHARKEMATDNLSDQDAINVLRAGVVGPPEWENGSWRYRVSTQRMTVVAAFEPDVDTPPKDTDDVSTLELVVVTAWRKRS